MTEEEAKNHLCPIAARNRRLNGEELGSNCVGADCMAWRWDAWRCGKGCGTVRVGTIEKEFVEPCKPPRDPKFYDHIGHCGLAGKP